jgi:hypothetical protein
VKRLMAEVLIGSADGLVEMTGSDSTDGIGLLWANLGLYISEKTGVIRCGACAHEERNA